MADEWDKYIIDEQENWEQFTVQPSTQQPTQTQQKPVIGIPSKPGVDDFMNTSARSAQLLNALLLGAPDYISKKITGQPFVDRSLLSNKEQMVGNLLGSAAPLGAAGQGAGKLVKGIGAGAKILRGAVSGAAVGAAIPTEDFTSLKERGKNALSGATVGGAIGLGGVGIEKLISGAEKFAGRLINSLIRPGHKEYMFGKNPGLGVAKEGIIAGDMEGLDSAIGSKIDNIKHVIGSIRSTPENLYKSVDLTEIRKPLVEAINKLKLTPRTNASEINAIKDAYQDITDLVTNLDEVGLGKVDINTAYKIKEAVSNMQKWTVDSNTQTELNKTIRQVYHSIDKNIDEIIPELSQLNDRMSNLISAKQAVKHRIEILSKQEPLPTLRKLIDLPFAGLKTVRGKTTLGRLIAKQYKLP